jgi:hypothetical protein
LGSARRGSGLLRSDYAIPPQDRPVPAGLAATTRIYPLARYAEIVEWVLDHLVGSISTSISRAPRGRDQAVTGQAALRRLMRS